MTVPKTFVDQKLLSTGEVAKLMRVHRGTVWHWIRVGLLRAEKVTDRYSGVSRKSLADFKKTYHQQTTVAAVPAAVSVSPKKAPASPPSKTTRRRPK